jgi:hypothetical protein
VFELLIGFDDDLGIGVAGDFSKEEIIFLNEKMQGLEFFLNFAIGGFFSIYIRENFGGFDQEIFNPLPYQNRRADALLRGFIFQQFVEVSWETKCDSFIHKVGFCQTFFINDINSLANFSRHLSAPDIKLSAACLPSKWPELFGFPQNTGLRPVCRHLGVWAEPMIPLKD